MFPATWDEQRIISEVDAAWNSPHKTVKGDSWESTTPSGVTIKGYTTPRTTAYPVYIP
ncbi:EndoU domain-containing protein [Pseudomonas sp. KCJK9016]|uniref:EndoU domain-containing protein n=1 Tax=Pseudomonas sp. KCJK9016 TaxID=3344556 RepID=UPI003905D92F